MNSLLTRLSGVFERSPDWLHARRRWVWAALILAVLVVGYGSRRLTIDMTLESFLIPGDPVKILYDRFKETFGSDEGIYIVYEARDGDVFSAASLNAVQAIQRALNDAAGPDGDRPPTPLDHILEPKWRL